MFGRFESSDRALLRLKGLPLFVQVLSAGSWLCPKKQVVSQKTQLPIFLDFASKSRLTQSIKPVLFSRPSLSDRLIRYQLPRVCLVRFQENIVDAKQFLRTRNLSDISECNAK